MKKQDFIIIAVVLVVAIGLFVGLYVLNGDSGSNVQVEIDGKVVDSFSISESLEKEYKTDGGTNVVVIKDGKVLMKSADCPDKICVQHKQIYRKGESIICLPHKVVVTVVGDSPNDDEVDAVA